MTKLVSSESAYCVVINDRVNFKGGHGESLKMFAVCSFNLYSGASGKSMDGMFCKLAEMAGLGVNGAR